MNDFTFCSGEKAQSGIVYKETIEGLDEWPHSWPAGEVSYRLNNYSEDFKDEWQTKAVVVALRTWQERIKNLKFRRERSASAHADLEVSWKPLATFSSPNVFAHAWFPGQGKISGDVEINDHWHYQPGVHLSNLARPPLVPIMIHEFGHSLGLRHDPTTFSSIMYPAYDMGEKNTELGPRDITRIQERYGVRTISQRILDVMAKRRLIGSDFD